MRYFLIIFLCSCLSGCFVTAHQSDDGKTLTIKGLGSAKFENGAEVKSESWFSKLFWLGGLR